MTRRGFYIVLAFVLLACVIAPYVEFAVHFNQNIFETGYDNEATLAIIVLLVVLALRLPRLFMRFLPRVLRRHAGLVLPSFLYRAHGFVVAHPEASPPLALRI